MKHMEQKLSKLISWYAKPVALKQKGIINVKLPMGLFGTFLIDFLEIFIYTFPSQF